MGNKPWDVAIFRCMQDIIILLYKINNYSRNSITPDQIVTKPLTRAQDPVPAKSRFAVATFPIAVRLPSGSSIALQVLHAQTIQAIKSQIEEAEPIYPAPHQRLVVPGYYDDLLDDEVLPSRILQLNDLFHLVVRG